MTDPETTRTAHVYISTPCPSVRVGERLEAAVKRILVATR